MGIHEFYGTWIRRFGPGVNTRQLPHQIEGILFDLNGLLHAVAQKVFLYGEGEKGHVSEDAYKAARAAAEERSRTDAMDDYVKELTSKIGEVVGVLAPKQYLVIAVDGVAPGAKVGQQRERRYASAIESDSTRPTNNFSTAEISPGTVFMMTVDNAVSRWISAAGRAGVLPRTVVYSSHLIPGEGEHKAFKFLRDMLSEGVIAQGSGAHVVYGMDSDLVVLSLASPVRNIYLSREDLSQNVCIDELFAQIKADMVSEVREVEFDDATLRRDFIVLTTLVGNDFMPNTPALTRVDESMFKAYTAIRTPLTRVSKDGSGASDVVVASLAEFYHHLGRREPALLAAVLASELKDEKTKYARIAPSRSLRAAKNADGTIDISKFKEAHYTRARDYREVTSVKGKIIKHSHFKEVFGGSLDAIKMRMIADYVAAVGWVVRYYTGGGESVNWLFAYRFILSPVISDVSEALKAARDCEVFSDYFAKSKRELPDLAPDGVTSFDGDLAARGGPAVAPVHVLLTITPPPRVEDVIPSKLLCEMIYEGGSLEHIAPTTFACYKDGKRREYMTVLILPEVDLLSVKKKVDSLQKKCEREAAQKHYDKIVKAREDAAKNPEDTPQRVKPTPVMRPLIPKSMNFSSTEPMRIGWSRLRVAVPERPPRRIIPSQPQVHAPPPVAVKVSPKPFSTRIKATAPGACGNPDGTFTHLKDEQIQAFLKLSKGIYKDRFETSAPTAPAPALPAPPAPARVEAEVVYYYGERQCERIVAKTKLRCSNKSHVRVVDGEQNLLLCSVHGRAYKTKAEPLPKRQA